MLLLVGMIQTVRGDDLSGKQDLLQNSQRVVFLGDSITYAGHYVTYFDAWLLTQELEEVPTVINVGLPSETVSGLSEEGHAGGKFPRPHLAERLDRVLAKTKPDLVFACYGMNCGIYKPLDKDRFAKYQQGIGQLKEKVEALGAKFIVMTPPIFDDQVAQKSFSYNQVLDAYAAWLVEQREQGWLVIDLHTAMQQALERRRKKDPDFTFQGDAVHPNQAGHWVMAQQLFQWFGDEKAAAASTPEAMLSQAGVPEKVFPLIQQRSRVLRNASLSAAGHKRPGIKAGLPIPEAKQQAEKLTEEIQELLK